MKLSPFDTYPQKYFGWIIVVKYFSLQSTHLKSSEYCQNGKFGGMEEKQNDGATRMLGHWNSISYKVYRG